MWYPKSKLEYFYDPQNAFLSKKESIAIITLSRPNLKNGINTQMFIDLRDIQNEIYWDNDIRVVIITGKGKSLLHRNG
jgi:enoyl-CoA hydratase/carnithine racemase